MPPTEESVLWIEQSKVVFDTLRTFYMDAVGHADTESKEEEMSADLNLNPLFISSIENFSETKHLLQKSDPSEQLAMLALRGASSDLSQTNGATVPFSLSLSLVPFLSLQCLSLSR
jgi:hypothetical protein